MGPKPARGDKTVPVFGTLESGVRTLFLVEREECREGLLRVEMPSRGARAWTVL